MDKANQEKKTKHKDSAPISFNPAKIFQDHFKKPPMLELVRPPVVFGTNIFLRFKVNQLTACKDVFVVRTDEAMKSYEVPYVYRNFMLIYYTYVILCTRSVSVRFQTQLQSD